MQRSADAAFTHLCPVTKHLPAHPRHDLIADFPLPPGAVLDDDPVLARSDDDEWQRGDRRLDLSWSKAHDDLVHAEGTRLISVDDFSAAPQTPACTQS